MVTSLKPGEPTGRYRLGSGELLLDAEGNSTISLEDLAVALLMKPSGPSTNGPGSPLLTDLNGRSPCNAIIVTRGGDHALRRRFRAGLSVAG